MVNKQLIYLFINNHIIDIYAGTKSGFILSVAIWCFEKYNHKKFIGDNFLTSNYLLYIN